MIFSIVVIPNKRRLELADNLRSDFKAAGADGGADGGVNIFGIAVIVCRHFLNGFSADILYTAPPAGMDGRNNAICWVRQKDGDTIRRKNHQNDIRTISDESIGIFYVAAFGQSLTAVFFGNISDVIGMGLFARTVRFKEKSKSFATRR